VYLEAEFFVRYGSIFFFVCLNDYYLVGNFEFVYLSALICIGIRLN
jgi:hypothetical protein